MKELIIKKGYKLNITKRKERIKRYIVWIELAEF
jgi:hypothetical protein